MEFKLATKLDALISWVHLKNVGISQPYILKAGLAGWKNSQMILNFPQRDCLRTQKLSILQCVKNNKVCMQVLQNMFFGCRSFRMGGNTFTFQCSVCGKHFFRFCVDLHTFVPKKSSRFTHFFRRILETEKANSADWVAFRMYVHNPCCYNSHLQHRLPSMKELVE